MESKNTNIKVGSFINIKLPDNHFKPTKKISSNQLINNSINKLNNQSINKSTNQQTITNNQLTTNQNNLNQNKLNQSKLTQVQQSTSSTTNELTNEEKEKKLNEFANKLKSIHITELNKLQFKDDLTEINENFEKNIYSIMAPFEYFIDNKLDSNLRISKFFKYLKEDDYLIGIFRGIKKNKSDIKKAQFKLTSFDGGLKIRLIHDLNLYAYYLIEEDDLIDDLNDNNKDEYFRFKVDKIIKDQIFVKFKSIEKDKLSLGLIKFNELPVHFINFIKLKKREEESDLFKLNFNDELLSNKQFNNPNSIDYLVDRLQIDYKKNNSHLKNYNNDNKLREQFKNELQSGINCLKKELFNQSELHLNTALKIEPNNSDVWCAFGCLYANQMIYEKSIKEFYKAIKLNSNNLNAKKYLLNVLIVYGQKLMKQNNLDDALNIYNQILNLDNKNEDAIKNIKLIKELKK